MGLVSGLHHLTPSPLLLQHSGGHSVRVEPQLEKMVEKQTPQPFTETLWCALLGLCCAFFGICCAFFGLCCAFLAVFSLWCALLAICCALFSLC